MSKKPSPPDAESEHHSLVIPRELIDTVTIKPDKEFHGKSHDALIYEHGNIAELVLVTKGGEGGK